MAVSIQGVENRFAVPDIIAKEALYRLKHHLVMPQLANKTYQKYFESSVGDTITVKRPFKARVQTGRKMKKAEMIDKTVEFKIDQRHHFALEVVDEDVLLNIVDYGNRYLDAGAEELAYVYDIAGADALGNGLFMSEGTPGTELALATAQDIRAHATKMAIPKSSQNFALLDPLDIAKISADIQAVDMPEMVGQNIREAYQGKLAGWHVIESVHVPHLDVIGTLGAPLVDGANQRGSSINTDGWTASKKVLKKGNLIQLAGVGEVQPRGDRRVTGNTMTFVVTADVSSDAQGDATIPIYPEINDGTSDNTVSNPSGKEFDGTTDKANLDASAYQTVDSEPADDAVITVLGTAASAKKYRQGLYFCGDALEYLNLTLPKPKSASYAGSERDEETGVSISYLADFDIEEATEAERLDIFFGVKAIYEELGIRHIGDEI